MNLKSVFVILTISALVAFAPAQQQGMRGAFGNPAQNPSILLRRDDVKTDLQLTDDQKSKLFDLEQGLRDRFSEVFRNGGSDPETRQKAIENIVKKIIEDVNKILTTGQLKRLKEIAIQVAGNSSAALPEIQKELSITADQKTKIADLMTRQAKATSEAVERMRNGEIQSADVQEAVQKNQKILNEEIGKLLTQAQRDKLKTLGGKTFVPAETSSGLR